MKKISVLFMFMLCGGLLFTSCSKDEKDDDNSSTVEITDVEVTQNISQNTTWTKNNVYLLKGRIAVESGATLTIEAGTVIKGQAGEGASASALLVARGAKLMAEGTASAPIIFTSEGDNISPKDIAAGNYASPNLQPTVNGLWGGVIVLGNGKISASNDAGDVSEVQIEGIPTSDPNGLYGGNNDSDNSGVIKYISIRHGGALIGAGNEINGLTLGAVGSGTVVENVEVIANQDDGIELFGGTVNVKNVVIWNSADDGLDTDQSWSGTIDNFVIVTPVDDGHVFELDGPEGSMKAGHTLKNGSVIVGSGTGDLINTDNNSIVNLENIYFTGIAGHKINRVSHSSGTVNFTNIVLNVSDAVSNYVPDGATVPAGVTAGTSPKADTSVFGWTWTSQAGVMTF